MEHLKAREIVELLGTPANDKTSMKSYITAQASTIELVGSLELATDTLTQQILSDIAGERFEEATVPVLLKYLQSPSPDVRSSAADALGKIGDGRAGLTLLERFDQLEKDAGVRHMLATALGACGYREAIPLLIGALNDPDPVLRGCIAWALGAMGAESGEDALRSSLQHERDGFAKDRMQQALNTITLVNQALKAEDRKWALDLVLTRLASDSQFVTAFVWALGKLGGEEARDALIHILVRVTGERYVARRIEDALLSMEQDSTECNSSG